MSLKAEVKKTRANLFRRLYLKRKQMAGFESTWQLIPERYIKSWGSNSYSVNDIKVNFFELSGQTVQLLNIDNYFSDEKDNRSFFFGASTRYGTLCKIEAGFTADDGTEYPTDQTIFTGYLKQSLRSSEDATLSLNFKPMASAFTEYLCKNLVLSLTATHTVDDQGVTTTAYWAHNTATELLGLIEAYQQGGVDVYDDYISDWQVLNTSEVYSVNTATIGDTTHWDLITKLAIAENCTTYVDRAGVFYFMSRNFGFETTDYPDLNGIGAADMGWGHTIKKLNSVYDNIDNVYNYIRVKHDETDTATSYYKYEEDWTFGDRSSAYLYGLRKLEIDNIYLTTAGAEKLAEELYRELKNPVKTVELETTFFPVVDMLSLVDVDYKMPRQGDAGSPLWGAFLWSAASWASGGTRYIVIDQEQYKVRSISHDLDNFNTSFRLSRTQDYFIGGYNSSYYNRNLYGE